MAVADHARPAQHAQRVLAENRRGSWTCPSSQLYPHQWLWDSCFTAIGLARVDPMRAAGEMRALLRGQWSNGMLPHMIFADGTDDFGSRHLWRSHRYAAAPRGLATSCITQPPLPAIAVEHVARFLDRDERQAFLAEMFPALVAYHGWLYRERDLDRTGLVTLIHCAKRAGFDLARIRRRRSVLLQDLAFNSLLAVANRSLVSIADALDEEIEHDLGSRLPTTAIALEELWDEERGRYGSRDVTTGALIALPTVATFLPLWAEYFSPLTGEGIGAADFSWTPALVLELLAE